MKSASAAHALLLRPVAVQGGARIAVAHQLARSAGWRRDLGPGEHQHLAHVAVADQVLEEIALAPHVHLEGRVASPDRSPHCWARPGCAPDRSASASAKRLMSSGNVAENIRLCRFAGSRGEDALDVGHEAHVQHAVGLVQHQDLDLAEIHGALVHVVEQAPRGRHQDLDTGAQFGNLRIDVDRRRRRTAERSGMYLP